MAARWLATRSLAMGGRDEQHMRRNACGTVLYSEGSLGWIRAIYNRSLYIFAFAWSVGSAPQMDDALMAKEAEKSDLMKRRQKFRGKLASSRLTGAELERVR